MTTPSSIPTHISVESGKSLCQGKGGIFVHSEEATCPECQELYAWLKRSFEGH